MANKKSTKRALMLSALSLLLCVSMFVGTTFAWFTDSVSTVNNKIVAGNLDVELEYYNLDTKAWETVDGTTNVFTDELWEPGHTEVVYLKVKNAGTLALKYQLGVNIVNEIEGVNVNDKPLKLSEYIYFDSVEGTTESFFATRDDALKIVDDEICIREGYGKSSKLYAEGKGVSEEYVTLVVYMPTTVGNEANYKTGTTAPEIDLGINLYATQLDYENDSFGPDYDEKASVTVEPGQSIADAINAVEDGGVVYLENGTHNLSSGPIVIDGKTVTIIGVGNVTINKNYGSTHIFTVKNGSNVTIENVTMDGKGNTREGVYVRWNSVVTLKDVVIKNTGGLDIMIDEASDAAHGKETASRVWLYNTHIEDVAMCASPVTSVAATQNTYVYFNYDADSTVGSIDVQSINLKPENVIINGVASTEVGKTMQLYVSNDAELAAALNTIKTDSAYWNKEVIIYMAAGTYSADHVINQYPQWNGTVGAGSTANNYASGVPTGAPNTVINFVGPVASAYGASADVDPVVVFTGNVTVNGFGNAGTGFATAVARTTFQNIKFDAANSADNEEDSVVMYVKAAANNVSFEGCKFVNATHITLGGSAADGAGNVSFDNCVFNDGGCLSGYVETLSVTDSTVTAAKNGFINKSKAGTVTVENCDIDTGRYFIRTSNSGVVLNVADSDITVYEAEGTKHLVWFRGSNEKASFVDCTIADGYTFAGVDANSTVEIYNYSETSDGLTLVTDGITDEVTLYLVPSDYEGTIVEVPEGVDTIGNYAFYYNSNVKEVVLSSTVRDLGRGFDSSTVEKVVLNEGLTTISSRAFKATTALKEVVISSTVTEIADDAFQKTGLKTITIPANVDYIGVQAFGASKIENVIIEGNVTINNKAFRGCPNLRTMTINGDNIEFINVNSGSGDCWICNSESNNSGTTTITFNVKNPVVAEKVKAAMGIDLEKVTINCEIEVAEDGTWTDKDGSKAAYVNDTTIDDAITAGAETVYLSSGDYIIPSAAKGKTLTIIGTGDTSVAVTKVGTGGENCDYGLDGSTVVFENITITTNSSTYIGYARCNATYNNCTINGTYTLYGDSEFNNCTFNVSGDVYNIWTWGAPNATFNNCTFNSDGKAMLLYGTANTNLTLSNCTFNDKGGLTDKKAAVEIGNDYGKTYNLIVNNTTVNGYEINDKGINTGTTLWGNKNSMGTDKLNVVVDGVDVY